MDKLKELCKLYKKCNIDYSFDDNELIEYDQQTYNDYEIDIKYNILNKEHYIFIIVEKKNKLIFKGLYKKDKDNLSIIYDDLKNDLYSLDFNTFIDKYYMLLKNSFIN